MKNILFLPCLFIMFFAGCAKEEKGCTTVEPKAEEGQMMAYATANGISAVKHSSGMYYEIVSPGTGANPTINSTVTVNYVGKFLNGSIFDQSTAPVTFPLTDVIEGWGIGIPLIKKGGTIKLIIPSAYAYGCNGRSTIPPNTVLYFEVQLVNVE